MEEKKEEVKKEDLKKDDAENDDYTIESDKDKDDE